MQSTFVARQPIYDRHLQVIGYELLYRARDTNHAEFANGDSASTEVILNSFINIGIDELVGSALAFINVPELLLLNDALLPMFHEQTVLELLEPVRPHPKVIAGIQRLKARGFRIALDDVRYGPELRPLLALADYIKVNVQIWGATALADQAAQLRPYAASLVAEKVETPEQFRECRTLGFDCFQGYFFCRPETMQARTPPPHKVVVLDLLQQLSDPRLSMDSLQATLANDVSLSYKLLRYVNSAAFGRRREIESIRDAIALVGLGALRNWATLVLFNSLNSGKPRELIKTAMVRARMCDLLAGKTNVDVQPQMFVVGLFSVLDAVMDTPMATLLDHLTLSASIKFALLDHAGVAGRLLQQVLWYEQGQWQALLQSGADREELVGIYLQAVQWADAHIERLFG